MVSDGGVVFDGIYIDDVSVSYESYSCKPGEPELITPTKGSLVTSPVTFEWADSGTGGSPSGFVFQLDGTPVVTFTTPVTTTTMMVDTSGQHTWSVKAFNAEGESDYAGLRDFWMQFKVFMALILNE